MARQEPKFEPAAFPNRNQSGFYEQNGIIYQTREYQVITPIFGGGVEPGESDAVTPVRGSTIRGQLRFWWRAIRGGQFGGDMTKMKAAEDAIFGTMTNYEKQDSVFRKQTSLVIDVANIRKGSLVSPFQMVLSNKGRWQCKENENSKIPAYAAFPLQPSTEQIRQQGGQAPIGKVRKGVSFTLRLAYQADTEGTFGKLLTNDEINATLWAWETFGGIGARTRRGFGTIQCLSAQADRPLEATNSTTFNDWLNNRLIHYIKGQVWPEHIPHLSNDANQRRSYINKSYSQVENCWLDLIDALKYFRQQRDYSSKVPGLNDWPEPDAIRERRGRIPKRESVIDRFPRAAFGMPIIFHYKDDELPDETLRLEHYDRLASPLILKPVSVRGQFYIPLAIILQGSEFADSTLRLEDKFHRLSPVSAVLTPEYAKELYFLEGKTDVLEAFLDYLWTWKR